MSEKTEDLIKIQLRTLLWAKTEPFKPLKMHLLETGIVAQELIVEGCFVPLEKELECYLALSRDKVLSLVGYIASVHDIGKASLGMAQKASDMPIMQFIQDNHLMVELSDGFRHELYGGDRLEKIWLKRKRFKDFDIRTCLADVIRLHHQGKNGGQGVSDIQKEEGEQIWEELQEELEEEMWGIFQPVDVRAENLNAVCMILLGLVIVADWIASGETFAGLSVNRGDEEIIRDTQRLMKQFLADNHMQHHPPAATIDAFTKLWPNIPKKGMRPLQQEVERVLADEQEMPLGVILEAPMGCGKTEAGLYAACRLAQRWGKEGFYVALPTAATSNQMYGRMNDMLKALNDPKAKLMHSMAWLMDEKERRYQTEDEMDVQLWTAPMRRGLIAPFAVGSVDQVMMSVMRTKYGVLRLAGLTQKVLIIDELHSYDAYMGSIIETLLKWCRVLHVPVVMLSATLPAEKKESFARCYAYQEDGMDSAVYPAITLLYDDKPPKQIAVPEKKQQMQVHIELEPYLERPVKIASLLKTKMGKAGGCCCVLVNTVSEAQDIYLKIRAQMPEIPCILFHARFSANRRQEIEQSCLEKLSKDKSKRPKQLIVVATQVVEQSLDLDFDYMISDICPIDLLLQRMGRLWRHMDTIRPEGMQFPEMTVLVPEADDFQKSGVVYPEIILQRSVRELLTHKEISLPEDIPVMVQHVYDGYVLDEKTIDKWMMYQVENEQQRSASQVQKLGDPLPDQFCLTDCMAKAGDLFYSDEDTSFLPAKTRLGEVSRRIAIVPEELFDQLVRVDRPSRKLAKEVLGYSVNVAERKIKRFLMQQCADGRKPMDGQGLLMGTWILPGVEGRCSFQQGGILEMNEELGFLIEEGEKGEL